MLLLTFTVVTTLLWERVFCAFPRPFGILQDFLERILPRRRRHVVPGPVHRRATLAASAVVPCFYCRYVCPLGAALDGSYALHQRGSEPWLAARRFAAEVLSGRQEDQKAHLGQFIGLAHSNCGVA